MTSVTSAMWAVRGAPVLLVPELDGGVGPIVEQPLDPSELALRVVANAVRDLGVLALDDRPHASPPGDSLRWVRRSSDAGRMRPCRAVVPTRPSAPSIRAARRGSALAQRSRATAMAETATAPPSIRARRAGRQGRAGRHDVVDEQDPAPGDRAAAAGPRPRGRKAPATFAARGVATELELGDASRGRAPAHAPSAARDGAPRPRR